MKWRARARRRARARALKRLFPAQRAALADPRQDVLVVAVPVTKSMLNAGSAIDRAEVCEYVGGAARIEAVHATRKRVGSSALSPAEQFMTGWVNT